MKRFRERPSMAHVIATCFAFFYLLVIFVQAWMALLNQPALWESYSFWLIWLSGALGLYLIGRFLVRELLRQARLSREWKSQ